MGYEVNLANVAANISGSSSQFGAGVNTNLSGSVNTVTGTLSVGSDISGNSNSFRSYALQPYEIHQLYLYGK